MTSERDRKFGPVVYADYPYVVRETKGRIQPFAVWGEPRARMLTLDYFAHDMIEAFDWMRSHPYVYPTSRPAK